MYYSSNPKTLNLEGLETQTQKVTVGFRCEPKRKISLAQEAAKDGITLSEHVETIVDTFMNRESFEEEIEALQSKIKFYENRTLLGLFQKYQGQVFKFTSVAGDYMEVEIKAPTDVYTLLINSFK